MLGIREEWQCVMDTRDDGKPVANNVIVYDCGDGEGAGGSDKGDRSMGADGGLAGRDNGSGGCSDIGDRVTGTGVEGLEGGAGAVVKDDDDDSAMDNPGGSVGVVLDNDADVTILETAENSWG